MASKFIFISFAIGFLLVLSPSGCGDSGAKGPDTAVSDYVHLLNARDFGTAYDALSEESRIRTNSSKKEFVSEQEKFFTSNPASFRLSNFSAQEIIIDGDTATVAWSGTWVYGFEGDEGDTIHVESSVVFEDDVWKVDDLWGN